MKKSTALESIEEKYFCEAVYKASGDTALWLNLIDPKDGIGVSIGLDTDGQWVAYDRGDLIIIDKKYGSTAAWLLLLEYDLYDVRQKILKKSEHYSLGIDLGEALPFTNIICEGLSYGGRAKVSSALGWLESDNSLISTLIYEKLKPMYSDKKFSQNIRHRARKLVRIYERTV